MIIPVAGIPDETFTLSLANKLYKFRFQYNARFDYWIFSMYLNEVPLFEGLKIVQCVHLGEQYNLDIGGFLEITSVSGDDADPTRDDFGKDKLLNYVTTVQANL